MKTFSQFAFVTASFAVFTLFTACGDDVTEVTEVNEIHQDGIAVLDAGLELSKQKCDSTNVGDMLFVTDSSEVFVCNGKFWQTLKGADGKDGEKGAPGENGGNGNDGASCTAKPVKNEAGVEGLEVTCGKTVVGTIWNGVDGNDGDDGESCTAKPVKNEAGVEGLEVTCGKTVVGTIWNGHDGAGCTLNDDGKGSVTVTCGEDDPVILYKAMCATEPYDPAKSFCSEGKPYSCNDEPYDPKKQYCDTRDNQVYRTVTIGDGDDAQTWMAQNLNYAPDENQVHSLGDYAWSGCYGGKADSCAKYGRLYTWEVAMEACPDGWHLPSKNDWDALFENVGGREVAGSKLKSKNGWNGEDSYGFAVLPAGYRDYLGNFDYVGLEADFWSSTEYEGDYARSEYFYYDYSRVYELPYDKNLTAFSVRCLHDSN